jgi:thioester reductase-like protein
MTQGRTAFVTGGTGFLGSFLIEQLLRRGDRVVALVRGVAAEDRLLETLQSVGMGDVEAFREGGRLSVVNGDVCLPGFGLSTEELDVLAGAVQEIWHCAASLKFQERYSEEIAAQNISGTRNVIHFTRRCNQRRSTPMFHVSTAYAAPLQDGVVREELPSEDTRFRNRYEWSKQEAERLIGEVRREEGLPLFIFRPSIVIGHSRTGRVVRFTGYYDVFRTLYLLTRNLEVNLGNSFDRNLRLRIKADADVRLNVVPVDFVIEAMWRIARSPLRDHWIFNITNEQPPLLSFLFTQASRLLAVSGIELVSPLAFDHYPMSGLERIFNRKTQFQAPYLLEGPAFDTSHFRAVVPERLLPCPRIDEALMFRMNGYYSELLNRQFGMPQPHIPVALDSSATGSSVAHVGREILL